MASPKCSQLFNHESLAQNFGRERRLGQGGRGRPRGGEKPMGTTAYGEKGSKGRAANGDRPVGAANCRREQHTMVSCRNPLAFPRILSTFLVSVACASGTGGLARHPNELGGSIVGVVLPHGKWLDRRKNGGDGNNENVGDKQRRVLRGKRERSNREVWSGKQMTQEKKGEENGDVGR